MKQLMAIFDTDAGYAENLARNLMGDEAFPYHISGFSRFEDLMTFLNTHEVSFLLADRKDAGPELRTLFEARADNTPGLIPYGACPDLKLIYLTDLKGFSEIDQTPAVYKYQSAGKLAEELLLRINARKKASLSFPEDNGFLRIIGTAGPVGRCGKTSFSLLLGQLLSKNQRVLYASLEPCSGLSALLEEDFKKDLSDLLYAYQTGDLTAPDPESWLAEFHGLYILPPPALPEDLYDTPPGLIRDLLAELCRKLHFDLMILDLGGCFSFLEAFLPSLSRLYIPSRTDPVSREKTASFLSWVKRSEGFRPSSEPEEIFLPLPSFPFLSGKKYLEQLLFSEAGEYVRAVLERES